jgi:hypothetical protein
MKPPARRGSGRHRRQVFRDIGRRAIAGPAAGWVAEPARAHAIGEIEHDIVRMGGVAGDAADRAEMVEREIVAQVPGDQMVLAGRVAADANAADLDAAAAIERQASTQPIKLMGKAQLSQTIRPRSCRSLATTSL